MLKSTVRTKFWAPKFCPANFFCRRLADAPIKDIHTFVGTFTLNTPAAGAGDAKRSSLFHCTKYLRLRHSLPRMSSGQTPFSLQGSAVGTCGLHLAPRRVRS
jgi:hypothetical protein